MVGFLLGLFRLVWLFGKGNQTVVLENLALRQQLAVYKRRKKRPRLAGRDRWFWSRVVSKKLDLFENTGLVRTVRNRTDEDAKLRRCSLHRVIGLLSGTLNGDGIDEIIICPPNGHEVKQWSEEDDYAYLAGLVVFDRAGKELTRGKFCSQYMGYSEERACPIVAKKVEFETARRGGLLDIVTTGWIDDAWLGFKGPKHRLHLVNTHYEPEPAAPASRLRSR